MCDTCGCNVTPANEHLVESVDVLKSLLDANDRQAALCVGRGGCDHCHARQQQQHQHVAHRIRGGRYHEYCESRLGHPGHSWRGLQPIGDNAHSSRLLIA